MFLAVVRRRDRHRRAPGGANVDGLQAVAPQPPGQVAHEGARRGATRGGAYRALQHGGEAGADALVRDGPQLRFALRRVLCRPGRWSTRRTLQRPPEGSAQVDGKVAKIDLAARGVDGALVQFNAPSWAVRAVMSSTTLPVCPKTGSTSPSRTVHLCLHTAPGNRECARARLATGLPATALAGLDFHQLDSIERFHPLMTRFPFPRLCLAREPEIQHLDVALHAEHDVRRLQIAMDHPCLVRGLQRLGNLLRNRQRLIQRDRPLRNAVRERRPFHQLGVIQTRWNLWFS